VNRPGLSLLLGSRKREGISDAIYCELVARLYDNRAILVAVSIAGLAFFGGAAVLRTGDLGLAAIVAAGCVEGALLIAVLMRASPAEIRADAAKAQRAERCFAILACTITALVGALGARAIASTSDPLVNLMLFAVTMSAMSMTVRNHYRPRIVLWQLVGLLAPTAVALLLHKEGAYWLLILGTGVLAFTTANVARTLYRGVRANLSLDEQLELQNLRFEAALDNMAQGLCMFDDDANVLICNRRYLEIYGFSSDVVKAGIPLAALIQHSVSVGNHPASSAEEITQSFLSRFVLRQPETFHNALSNGRTIAVSYEPMSDGGWVTTHEDITERQAAEARIAYLARHDPLTDLPNRTVFREALEAALVRTRRGGQVAVLCLDLDRFKAVNDTLGHAIGDRLLQEAGARLKAVVRETDLVARLGGDEFAIVEVGSPQPTSATLLADRVVTALSRPFRIDEHEISVGCSIGVSIGPSDGAVAEQLLRNADLALYRAKAEGRGQHRFFASEMDERMQARRRLELDLRSALAAGELELAYQPLVCAATGEISGFEALLRWQHPTRGLVMPDEFIPLAEEIGLIVPIGDWVLREACATACGWPGSPRIAVNLSPVQFRAGNLANSVLMALSASGLAADRLELEITEGVLLADTKETMEVLHRLRSLGVRIAMDDFGTGYSSLSYLRAFPFDKIKIDRSFVNDILCDQEAMAIVRAVTQLGRSLGMSTTAEGIETEEQLDQLRADGCTEVQGFLLGRPGSAESARALLAQQISKAA
jgi:diguanylate cyclase (GGDEF)-like protein